MSSSVIVCGTGNWSGPKPGDPDNNVTLSATTVFGGIDVSWSYPSTYPHAVAHTLLYRGITANYSAAIQLGIVAGGHYYDKISVAETTQFYYWISIVSVNGTVGELIGPASATARVLGEQTLESISARIDAGVLALSLKTEIANITVLGEDLLAEVQARLDSNLTLQAALSSVMSDSDEARSYILTEVNERITADSALIEAINVLAVGVGDNAAAIVEETTVRANENEASSSRVTTLYAVVDENEAAFIAEQSAQADKNSATATSINQLIATTNENSAAISTEQTARSDADNALASDVTLLYANTGDNAAAILNESQVRTSNDSALASNINTVQSNLEGNISSVETRLETNINLVGEDVDRIGALYTAKVSVNGLIGGFGVYNDGSTVQAGFDVDEFWVGRTQTDKVKPFIVTNGVTYIAEAAIRDGSIVSAKIGTAQIDTLNLAGAAVTVPLSVQGGQFIGQGMGTYETINYGRMFLDERGIIYANIIASQAYGQGLRNSLLWLRVQDSEGRVYESVQGGQAVVPSPVVAVSGMCAPGWLTISSSYAGEDAGVRINSSTLFVIGAKR
jgi:hypothetical protein